MTRMKKNLTLGTGTIRNINRIKAITGMAHDGSIIEAAVADYLVKLLPLEGPLVVYPDKGLALSPDGTAVLPVVKEAEHE